MHPQDCWAPPHKRKGKKVRPLAAQPGPLPLGAAAPRSAEADLEDAGGALTHMLKNRSRHRRESSFLARKQPARSTLQGKMAAANRGDANRCRPLPRHLPAALKERTH